MHNLIKHFFLALCLLTFVSVAKSYTCCKGGNPDITLDGTTILDAVLNGLLDPDETNQGNICILIKDYLIIDANYTFTGAEIRLDTGAEIIVVNGNKLTIQILKGVFIYGGRLK